MICYLFKKKSGLNLLCCLEFLHLRSWEKFWPAVFYNALVGFSYQDYTALFKKVVKYSLLYFLKKSKISIIWINSLWNISAWNFFYGKVFKLQIIFNRLWLFIFSIYFCVHLIKFFKRTFHLSRPFFGVRLFIISFYILTALLRCN